MDDKADRDQAIVVVVQERAAARAESQRPAETMLHAARQEACGVDLPDLLQADAVLFRLAAGIELELGDELFGQRSARAFADQDVFAAQLHAPDEIVLRLAFAPDAHVAGRDTDHFALLAIQAFDRRESGIDGDAERLRPRAQPTGQ